MLNSSFVNSEERFTLNIPEINKNSKSRFKKFEEVGFFLNTQYEDSNWKMKTKKDALTIHNLDFEDFIKDFEISKLESQTINRKEFVILLKNWVTTLLLNMGSNGIIKNFSLLREFLQESNFLNLIDLDDVEYSIKFDARSDNHMEVKVNAITTFLETLNLPEFGELESKLKDIFSSLKHTKNTRKLPSIVDIFTFSDSLKKHFNEMKHIKEEDEFYPIYLWWNITSIIPIRPSEFAEIKREDFIKGIDGFYIKIPRKKAQEINKSIQILDVIKISEPIGESIEEYLRVTRGFPSETLINYNYLSHISKKNGFLKLELEKFNIRNLDSLLKKFYYNIIKNKYDKKYDEKLTLIHSRHIAFCSMMFQGFSPIDIARIGGHTSIHSQFHYSNHIEFFIDNEIFNLLSQEKEEQKHSILAKEKLMNEMSLIKIPETMIPLDFGYCTDKEQLCESFSCLDCSKFYIPPNEIRENTNHISKEIFNKKEEIIQISELIEQIYKTLTNTGDVTPELEKKLEIKSKKIRKNIEQIKDYMKTIGGNNFEIRNKG